MARGEAPSVDGAWKPRRRRRASGHPGSQGAALMERVVSRPNLKAALKRVRKNKGSPGIDGMTAEELLAYLWEHWARIREELLAGTYQPSPVKRQQIPKSGGGVRELGIPTVLDRFIQQALLQVLQPELRRELFRAQLRFPAEAQRARRGDGGEALRPGRTPVGGGRGPGEVLRPRQPRRADGQARETDRGPSGAGADPSLSRRRGDGERGSDGAAARGHRKAVRSRRCSPTCSSTKWTRNWRSAATPSCATPTTATCTCAAAVRASE